MKEPMNDQPNDSNDAADEAQGEAADVGFFQIVGSTIAAAFGVQSSKNRERDFTRGKASHFIVAGIIFTVVFALTVFTVVQLVLPD